MTEVKRIIAVYCRVSSDDQRDRETIRTQQDTIQRRLNLEPDAGVLDWYLDDGVSGTIPMERRRRGADLIKAALAHRFTELWFTRSSRLSRDEIEALKLFAFFEGLGIQLIGVSEPVGDRTMFGFSAVMDAASRRKFLADSARGMERAAREGRYTGGVVTFGYRVEGKRHMAFPIPDEEPLWKDWSAADIVRRMFDWSVVDGWSCVRIADHLNALGIPTSYAHAGRLVKDKTGTRKKATTGIWRPSRVRAILSNPTYKGELYYGRRPAQARGFGVIQARVQALVPAQVWEGAQHELRRHAFSTNGRRRSYLLRSLLKCGLCGLTYSGTPGRGELLWYRCNGAIQYRRPVKCKARSIFGNHLHDLVWADIERYLRDPGDVIDDLRGQEQNTGAAAAREAELLMLRNALADLPNQKDTILDLRRRQKITEDQMDRQMAAIDVEERTHARRLAELEPEPIQPQEAPPEALLAEIRSRLDAGLDFEAKQEIVFTLVNRITVHTEIDERGKKQARVVVEYNFPGVVPNDTGRGCRRRPA